MAGDDETGEDTNRSSIDQDDSAKNEPPELKDTESTLDQVRRRRKGTHWKFTVPLGFVAVFFLYQVLKTRSIQEPNSNSASMLDLGIAAAAVMLAFLIYVKYSQEE